MSISSEEAEKHNDPDRSSSKSSQRQEKFKSMKTHCHGSGAGENVFISRSHINLNTIPLSEATQILQSRDLHKGISLFTNQAALRPIFEISEIAATPENISSEDVDRYTSIWESEQSKSEQQVNKFKKHYINLPFDIKKLHFEPSHDSNKVDSSNQVSENETLRVSHFIIKGVYTLDTSSLSLKEHFKNFFKTSKGLNITQRRIDLFFKEYGHIVRTRVKLGGLRYVEEVFEKSQLIRGKKTDRELGLKMFLKKMGVGLTHEKDVSNDDSKNSESQQYVASTLGGLPELVQSEAEWLHSLRESPSSWAVVEVTHSEPIYSFLDTDIRESLLYLLGLEEDPKKVGYRGEWVDGRREGTGKEVYSNGSSCEGKWVDDKSILFLSLGEDASSKVGENSAGLR